MFDQSGIVRGADGIARYQGLPGNLVAMLRETAEAEPDQVGAVLVPMPGGLDVAAVLAYLAGRLADFKIPQFVAVRPEPLPRNPGGKVLKRGLRTETEWSPAGK